MTFSIKGLNHLGIVVNDIALARNWFHERLGFPIIEDRGQMVFMMIGDDVLAVKTSEYAINKPEHGDEISKPAGGKIDYRQWQSLDHYGFYAGCEQEVDQFAEFLEKQSDVRILKGPYSRSDGRSVYFKDPLGMVGEYLYFSPKK